MLDLSSPLPHPAVHSILVSNGYQRISQSLVSFLTVFNICSHLFFTFDFGLSDCTTLCVQKTQRLHFSSAFPKQEQHPCSDLELLAQAFHLSTGQEVNVKGNTWKKAFQVNRHQKVLDLCASDSTVFSF